MAVCWCCGHRVWQLAATQASRHLLRCTSKHLEALRGTSRYFEEQKYRRSFPVRRDGLSHTTMVYTVRKCVEIPSCTLAGNVRITEVTRLPDFEREKDMQCAPDLLCSFKVYTLKLEVP